MVQLVLFCLLAAISVTPGQESQTLDLCTFLNRLSDLDGLALLEDGTRSEQASSYDRTSRYNKASGQYIDWRANWDHGHYMAVDQETGEGIMADLKGPGCIQRIWSANPRGMIRFYIDGSDQPIEFPFEDLCGGEIHPFVAPLVWKRSRMLGGDNPASCSYFPIPYGKSCRITSDTAVDQYYHIGYVSFPSGTPVKSFALPLSDEEEAALAKAQAILSNLGADPQPAKLEIVAGEKEIEPGEEFLFFDPSGPGVVCELRLAVTSDAAYSGREVLLKAFFDDQAHAAILSPIHDFFGRGFGETPYRSLPLGFEEDEGYCFFRMPFAQTARMIVLNQGKAKVKLRYSVGYRKLDRLPENAGLFHAGWRREKYCATFDYPVLACSGRGKLVGAALFVDNHYGNWWGEGDEKIFVDGEKFPSYFGTGTEDYFGDAWGIRDFENAFHGCLLNGDRQQSCYRWHIPDPVPFNRQLAFSIENYKDLSNVKNDYASIAYWYQLPGGNHFFKEPALIDCLPRTPSKVRGAVEAEALFTVDKLPEGARIIIDEEPASELSAGAGLVLTGKPGSVFYLPLSVPKRDLYRICAKAGATEPANSFSVTINGKPLKDRTLLEKGKVLLRIELRSGKKDAAGNCILLLDYFEFETVKKYIRDWMVLGPFDSPEHQGLFVAYPPEEETRVDCRKKYDGKEGKEVFWQRVQADDLGAVDLVGPVGSQAHAVAYAFATVTSPADQEMVIYLGSDDGVKLWVNQEPVHENRIDRGLAVDSDEVRVRLVKGINRVLVKVDQGFGAWGFSLRFLDEGDTLVYGLEGVQGE